MSNPELQLQKEPREGQPTMPCAKVVTGGPHEPHGGVRSIDKAGHQDGLVPWSRILLISTCSILTFTATPPPFQIPTSVPHALHALPVVVQGRSPWTRICGWTEREKMTTINSPMKLTAKQKAALIEEFALDKQCGECNETNKVPPTVINVEATATGVYGSAADFCSQCDCVYE